MTRHDIVTAIPTSFNRDGTLDLDGSRSISQYVARSGNEGAFALGTTGEFPAIDEAEFSALVEMHLEELAGHMRPIIHVGRSSTYEAVNRARIARSLGAQEFAAITPYYLPASEDAVFDYYRALSDVLDGLSLYVYVYPKRTGVNVSPSLMARLAGLPAVVGAKASELSLDEIGAYRSATPEGFVIYTGADRELIASGNVGADGVVSGVSSVVPAPFRALARAADHGNHDEIALVQQSVDDICSIIGGDMARMKEAYRILGIADGICRMAHVPPDEHARSQIRRVIEEYV